MKMHSIESRFVTGQSDKLYRSKACMCAFFTLESLQAEAVKGFFNFYFHHIKHTSNNGKINIYTYMHMPYSDY